MKRTVRTTMRPDQTVEVDDAEYLDLKRQGLLVEEAHTTVPSAPAVTASPVKKQSGAAGSKES